MSFKIRPNHIRAFKDTKLNVEQKEESDDEKEFILDEETGDLTEIPSKKKKQKTSSSLSQTPQKTAPKFVGMSMKRNALSNESFM